MARTVLRGWTTALGIGLVTVEVQAEGMSAAVEAGAALFSHHWVPDDPRASGDGLGPMYNASSCVACHNMGGPGGAGDSTHNVEMRNGTVLFKASTLSGYVEWRQNELNFALLAHSQAKSQPLPFEQGNTIRQRNTPALWGAGIIDQIPRDAIEANRIAQQDHETVSGRMALDVNGEPGRFGWKGDIGRLDTFVRQACSNEVGLTVPGSPQAPAFNQETAQAPALDLSEDDVLNLVSFIASLPAPAPPTLKHKAQEMTPALQGHLAFRRFGCDDCHVQNLGPAKGIYSDLLLHDLGSRLSESGGSYGGGLLFAFVNNNEPGHPPADPNEWRTPPLWGVADSAPYLHNGFAETLVEAILFHGGEAQDAVEAWRDAPDDERDALIAFLESLKAPTM
ncbi:MAG: di-heme oxidoredictase family protein [Myxococcota bacterium]